MGFRDANPTRRGGRHRDLCIGRVKFMKIEFFDTEDLEEKIALKVIERMKPLLSSLSKDTYNEDHLFTVETLAVYLSVSKQWVYERVQLKEIPHIKIGKFPRFKKKDINSWLETLETPAVKLVASPLKRVK
ncbi:MAG: helix-turn-helix domain-containing protein [Thermodesulfobacteriota bacterium]